MEVDVASLTVGQLPALHFESESEEVLLETNHLHFSYPEKQVLKILTLPFIRVSGWQLSERMVLANLP